MHYVEDMPIHNERMTLVYYFVKDTELSDVDTKKHVAMVEKELASKNGSTHAYKY